MTYKINTTYIAKLKKLKLNMNYVVCVARYIPKSLDCRTAGFLAPPADVLKKYKETGNEKEFTKQYRERILDNLDAEEVAKKLNGTTLVCFEKTGDFCHRHLIIAWLREKLRERIESEEL